MGCHTNSGPCQRCSHKPVKMRRFDPQTALNRAYTPPTCSDGADHWCILQLAFWAFRAYVGPQVQFPPKTRCDWWGAEKRRFDPQTALNRAYTPPTCSDGADHWCILQLAVWAFRAYVGPQVQFPPKTRCDWWGAEKRRFDPQTALNRAYTPPTCSDGAAH